MRPILPAFAVLAIWLSPLDAAAQQSLLRKADRLYEQYSFAEAITCYERAFEQGAQDNAAARRLADSYYRVRNLSASEKWYALVVAGGTAQPTDLLRYSEALRANAKYAKADSMMVLYAAIDTADSRGKALTSEMLPFFLVDPFFEGTVTPVTWNSAELDLGPALWNDQIVFASTRTPQVSVHRTHAWDGRAFLNLYLYADQGAAPLRGSVNTKYHESDATFSADGTEMYFTRNSHEAAPGENGEVRIDNLVIMSSRLVAGVWTEETNFPHQSPSYSTGHPSMSSDGSTLYFSSDRPGGYGGADIWRSKRAPGGEWQEPVNMGPKVNTEGEEMFPRAQANHALFFSSDGRAGLGGLDVFLTWDFSNGPQDPVNVGAPINSRADDMSLVLMKDGINGYFSSDREGGAGSTDIYQVRLDEPFEGRVRVNGRILSTEDGQPLANIPVNLRRPDRSVLAKQLTGAQGEYDFIIVPQTMTISAGIPGASELELPMDEHLLSAIDDEVGMSDIQLSTVVNVPLDLRVFDTHTRMPVPGMNVTLVDHTHDGRVVLQGVTDAEGKIHGELSQVNAQKEVQLDLTVSSSKLPGIGVQLSFFVKDALPRVLEQEYDMGDRMAAAFKDKIDDTFFFLYDQGADNGRAWSGAVLDRNDGTPISHVGISMRDLDGNEIASTTTAPDGRYRVHSHDIGNSILATIPGGEQVLLKDISPFGTDDVAPIELNSIMDLSVYALLKHALTGAVLPGARVRIKDEVNGRLIFQGITDGNGVCRVKIPGRRFGSEAHMEVSFEKDGYLPTLRSVDFTVLVGQDQPLGGIEGFTMVPLRIGDDIGVAMNLKPIFFGYKESGISGEAAYQLDRVVAVMRADTSLKIELRSHTDNRGGDTYNRELSQARSDRAKAYLVAHGVPAAHVVAVGVGEADPIYACHGDAQCTEAQHMANRRTEFLLIDCHTCGMTSEVRR